MDTILFAFSGNEFLAASLAQKLAVEQGKAIIRHFPDGETYIRILSNVKNKKVVLVCSLDRPDSKLLPLYFFGQTARDLGARCICVIAPYLAYMRQDKRFQSGEAVTSRSFAALVSRFGDSLLTVDPHLHRLSSLSDVYSIPSSVVHAAEVISDWINQNVERPLLVGPDIESQQWVSEVAGAIKAPFIILDKIRHGDKNVEVSVPQVESYIEHTPVLVDDIISTAKTMTETVSHIRKAGMRPPVCVGVHAVFAQNAFEDLMKAGPAKIITCNTIMHESNGIDISDLLIRGFKELSTKDDKQ